MNVTSEIVSTSFGIAMEPPLKFEGFLTGRPARIEFTFKLCYGVSESFHNLFHVRVAVFVRATIRQIADFAERI